MFHVVLFEPEIAPNTGNIMRLSVNIGCDLHLIRPLGFVLDDTRLRRAGLDYHEWARVQVHPDLKSFLASVRPERMFACSTRGRQRYVDSAFQAGDAFLFGPETRGLPDTVLSELDPTRVLRIPMASASRSINLSNAVAIVLYEAWRQTGFRGATTSLGSCAKPEC